MKRSLILIFFLFSLVIENEAKAQPKPGDYFREYIWTTAEDGSSFLRVGGRVGYRTNPKYYPGLELRGDQIPLDQPVNLKNALKAEIICEKVLCHDGTKGLRISVNENNPVIFPESPTIPEPQELYMHHFFPTVQIPLSYLKRGTDNYFSMDVDSIHSWKWPQNLVYGVIFRIYYPAQKSTPKVGIRAKQIDEQKIEISLDRAIEDEIQSVDFVAKYDGPDMDGDGEYDDWHYDYYRKEIRNHIGSTSEKPFQTSWDISWLPDQDKPILISARINFKSGLIYFAEPVELNVKRETYSVELCKPYNQPQKWLTRRGEHSENFSITKDPKQIIEAKMVFSTWSPGYFNGIYINDFLVFDREGPKYQFMQHDIPISYLDALQKGDNILKTGKTPKHHGQMVHGVEILWPGIMILVKSKKQAVSIDEETYKDTPHFKVETSSATWYIEKQSGGCSSLIDQDGNDWISFKKTGKEGSTNSADSDFRGLPNLVFRNPANGVGHPGFDQCTTEQVSENELLVKSTNGMWQYRWVFHPGFAEIAIEKTDESRNYWFLYEGPAGGKFSPQSHYWGNNIDGVRTDHPSIFDEKVNGNWQWVFFGDESAENSLFVAQQKPDELTDIFAYMGNSNGKGNSSEDGMNVFGFGRSPETKPLLSGKNRFFVGFFPEKTNTTESINELKNFINKIIQ